MRESQVFKSVNYLYLTEGDFLTVKLKIVEHKSFKIAKNWMLKLINIIKEASSNDTDRRCRLGKPA